MNFTITELKRSAVMKNQSRRFWLARTPHNSLEGCPWRPFGDRPLGALKVTRKNKQREKKSPQRQGYIYISGHRRRTIGQHVANGRGGHARRLSTQRHPSAPLSRESKRKTSSARKPPSLIVCDHCCNFVQIAECNSRSVNIKITHTQHSTPPWFKITCEWIFQFRCNFPRSWLSYWACVVKSCDIL